MKPFRFFLPEASSGKELSLPPEEAHHLREVLRVKEKTLIKVFNGSGSEFAARVVSVGRREVRVLVEKEVRREDPPRFELEVFLPVLKGGRTEYLVEKATELGATEIKPYLSSYTVRRPGERFFERLRRKTIEAAKQCGRLFLPLVTPPLPLSLALDSVKAGLKLFAYERSERTVKDALGSLEPFPKRVAVVSGPEGGFSAEEVELVSSKGFLGVNLGPYVLRADTAALFLIFSWRYYTVK